MAEDRYSGPDPGTPAVGTSDETGMNLKEYGPEDWVTLVFFWALAIVVFLQFFTRYALNDPFAWTEEIARYLLSCVAFLGGGMAVRRCSHIHVEFLYLYYPRGLARFLSTLVDLIRAVFFGYATWLSGKITQVMQTQPMVVVDWPMSIVYGICTVGFAVMTFRAVRVAVDNWRTGSSVLTRVGREGRHQ
ncbi:MAG TPA: TRAP transporter small permease, partial [Thermodesulfobacteriota bacterium]|nr:TRAP transporter small permease [Thermodesulfobacteriota bacterium]